jgi:16S rRNA (adenine1518-N6/adenine1519-N6)-dimethyltransferase
MRTKRRVLGQHFLNSSRFAERIAQIAKVEDKVVVEIGSGKGILTRQLAKKAEKVMAVEIDHRLAYYLQELRLPGVHVINRDFLRIDLRNWGSSVVVGNIPYSITTAILQKLVNDKKYVERVLLTVQKEYAARMMAAVGNYEYGYISIYANHHFQIRKAFNIPSRYFSPRPKVSSVVITLTPRQSAYDIAYEARLFEFIAGVFHYRRKFLKNAILNCGGFLPKGIDDHRFGQRPQHLSFDDYHEIYRMISGPS